MTIDLYRKGNVQFNCVYVAAIVHYQTSTTSTSRVYCISCYTYLKIEHTVIGAVSYDEVVYKLNTHKATIAPLSLTTIMGRATHILTICAFIVCGTQLTITLCPSNSSQLQWLI